MVECTLSITHCLRLNLQLHTIDLVSSFCTVAWQMARFQLTRRIARSLGDSWASCSIQELCLYRTGNVSQRPCLFVRRSHRSVQLDSRSVCNFIAPSHRVASVTPSYMACRTSLAKLCFWIQLLCSILRDFAINSRTRATKSRDKIAGVTSVLRINDVAEIEHALDVAAESGWRVGSSPQKRDTLNYSSSVTKSRSTWIKTDYEDQIFSQRGQISTQAYLFVLYFLHCMCISGCGN